MLTPARLLLLVALVAGLAVIGVLVFGESGAPPSGVGPGVTVDPRDAQPIEASAPAPDRGAEEVTQQRTEVAAAEPETEEDPEILAAMAGFRGRLVHADGAPAPSLSVLLYRGDIDIIEELGDVMGGAVEPEFEAGRTTSRDDGTFMIEGVWPRGMYLLHAGVGSESSTAMIVDRTPGPGETVDLGDIVLTEGAVLTGTVTDEAGEPVAGARVVAIDLPPAILSMVPLERFDPEGAIVLFERGRGMVLEMPSWVQRTFDRLPLPMTRTAQDGSFRLVGVPADKSQALVVTAPRRQALIRSGIRAMPGQEKAVGTLRMGEGEEVFGRVVEKGGRPVAGAEVLIGQGGPMGDVYFAGATVVADAEGNFSMPGFKPGRVVAAARRDHGQGWVFVAPQPVVRDLVIELPTTVSLNVKVLGPDAAPVIEPSLRLLPGRSRDGALELAAFGLSKALDLSDRTVREEDGTTTIEGLSVGPYVVLAQAPGYAIAAKNVDLTADTQCVLEVVPEQRLMLEVVDTAGRPIRSASVYATMRGRNRVRDMPVPVGRTAADGRVLVTGLRPGEVSITARHPKYGAVHANVTTPHPELRVVMQTPGHIEGVLTQAGGPPTPGKWMITVDERFENVRAAAPTLPRIAAPGVDGAFEVKALQPGRYRVGVQPSVAAWRTLGGLAEETMTLRMMRHDPLYVHVAPGQVARVTLDTEGEPDIVEGPSARISGNVMINGRPGAGMQITGWANRRLGVTVDASGHFDLGPVRVGHVQLSLEDPKAIPFGRNQLWSRGYKVEEGKDLDLQIVLETGAVVGRVLSPDGAPVPGVPVELSGQRPKEGGGSSAHLRAVTDESGAFSFDAVPAGGYAIQVNAEESGVGRLSGIAVAAGQRVAGLELRLERTYALSGTIDMTSFGNEAPDYIWLTFSQRGGAHRRWTQADNDGSFSVQGALPGDYDVSAWVRFATSKDGKSYVGAAPITVAPRDTSGVSVRLVPR